MKLLSVVSAAMLFLSAVPSIAGNIQANISGTAIQGSETTVAGSVQYDNTNYPWQEHVISDFLYQDINNKPIHENADIGVKLDRALNSWNYLQAGIRAEFDNHRPDQESITTEVGNGFRIIYNDKMKLSNEFGIGVHSNKNISSTVVSNSVWFSWKITPQVFVSNRFLTEQGLESRYQNLDTYVTNDAKISYSLSPHWALTLENKYKHEQYVRNHTTLLGVSVSF